MEGHLKLRQINNILKKGNFSIIPCKKNYFWRLGENLSKLLDYSSILQYSVFVVNLFLINVLIFLSIQGQVG